MGSGQYYDPHTGRFLTRGINPQQTNPYVPWAADSSGMLFAPLAFFSMVYGRRKKQAAKWEILLLVLLMGGSLTLGLSACGGGPSVTPTVQTPSVPVQSTTPTVIGTPTATGTPTVNGTPNETPSTECTLTFTPTNTATNTPTSFRNRQYQWWRAVKFARDHKNLQDFKTKGMDEGAEREVYENNCANFVSYALEAGGLNIIENSWLPSEKSENWVRSNELLNFLEGKGFYYTDSDVFVNTANLVIPLGEEYKNQETCLPFRVHNDYTKTNIQALNESQPTWPEYLERIQNTKPGDLVFYMDQTKIWSHVGMITTIFQPPTTYDFNPKNLGINFSDFQYGNEDEPRMIDHSGITSGDELPRSIGDSNSLGNWSIVILHQP